MRIEPKNIPFRPAVRFAAISVLALMAGACSSDITRFDYGGDSTVTGSITPRPAEPVGAGGAAPNYAAPNYGAPVANNSYSAAPLAPPANANAGANYASASNSYRPSYGGETYTAPNYQLQQGKQPIASGADTLARSQPVQTQVRKPIGQQPAVRNAVAAAPSNVQGATKKVAYGDTVYSISRAYGVSQDELLRANGMTSSSQLKLGQNIIIPGKTAPLAAKASTPVKTAAVNQARQAVAPMTAPASSPVRKVAAAGASYTVANGDTLYGIARAHNVRAVDIAAANNLQNGGAIRVGQKLVIPGGKQQPVRTAALETSKKVASDAVSSGSMPKTVKSVPVTKKEVRETAEKALREAASKRVQQPAAKPAAAPTKVAALEPAARSSSTFRWPVRGRVISAYGEKASGRTNDGINIAVPAGTSIRASENGVVAYSGNELEGYGNLVLVRHSDNWVTAYAHAGKLLVKKGDTVKRGQVIAQAGQTGAVDRPQVHFELRRGSKPVDPLKHLSSL